MSYYGWAPYVSVAEKRAKAERKLKQMMKKNPGMRPVRIAGKSLGTTWWGKSWNKNLELYADYSNRIGRGRSYVRHGAVLDLQIADGKTSSLVMGSRAKPYAVEIRITGLSEKKWKNIRSECKGKIDSLQKLLKGKFPKSLGEIFTKQGEGLFPAPAEIKFSCSCPDMAYMCKHVAATLYGIGARLDDEPSLFFTLRNIDMDDLISRAVKAKGKELLAKARKKTGRVIDDSDLSDVFGIDIAPDEDFGLPETKKRKKPGAKKAVEKKSAEKKTKASAKKKKGEKVSARSKKSVQKAKSGAKNPKATPNASDVVFNCIKKTKKGMGIADLKRKTAFNDSKLYNIIYRLRRQGRIKNVSRGIYTVVTDFHSTK